MEPFIIGIGHQMRVGKDTFASFLADHLRRRPGKPTVVIHHFADYLKEVVDRGFALDPSLDKSTLTEFDEIDFIKWGGKGRLTIREVYQQVGTGIREIYRDFWIRALERNWNKPGVANPDIVIIPDMRFWNEFTWVKSRGGLRVKVVRPDAPKSDHESEKDLSEGCPPWDHVILNEGSLGDLSRHAKSLAKLVN